MSAVQDVTRQQQGNACAGSARPWSCPLLGEPPPLIGYVTGVLACYLMLAGWEAARTPVTGGEVTLFLALMCCGAVCVEATRRLGQPTGVWRDLLSAWWLPVALLLPPLYALIAPAVLGLLIYVRVNRGAVYRRAFSSAALGLAGAFASALFRLLTSAAPESQATGALAYPGPNAWLLHPDQAAIAAACAVAFAVLNTCLIAVAAWLVNPEARLADMLWDRERMLLDLTETCVGILVTIACGLSSLLLAVALPPVVLLQRSLLHSQLKAQARTDPKTGVLNSGAWQGEADLAVERAARRRESLAVLLADLDHFKMVNDTHGHLTGDAVLRTLATEMRQQVRETDLVGRFGGEEFAILLRGTTEEEACRVAERIRRGAGVVRVLTKDSIVGVTVSIGVAVLGSHGDDLSELLNAADLALYRAKRAGRDRVCLFNPDDRRKAPRKLEASHHIETSKLVTVPEFIYSLRAVRKAHGDKVVLDNVTLSFLPGAKIGVVGPNGTGKSTLLKIMAGIEQASNGEARLMPGFTVGILAQEPRLNEEKTVLGNVEEGVAETKKLLDEYNEIAEKMATDYSDALMEQMSKLQEQIDHKDAWDLDSQLEQAMDALRCPPPDADVTTLSGGERRRVALCKLLLQQPDLLLLDEPTNHLDAESVLWLEQHLEKYPGTVIAVTHDRYFMENVAQWILELDRGHAYPYEGNYSTYLETKASRIKVEGAKDAKMRKRLDDELEWVRSSARARQTKSRARLERYEEMAAEADKNRKLDFEEIQIPPGPRLGNSVVEVEHLVKGFDDRVLYDDLSFSLPRNGIVGVIGPNGVGKTTLFKMIVGEEKPDSGVIRVGDTVKVSYSDQNRAGLDPTKNVWQAISDGETFIHVGNVEIPSRAYAAAFGFKGSDQQKLAGVMSGGERNRMNLALTLKQGGNLLLLDEPTNDLDVETLTSLENALLDFPGCAVITSHDRWFLDRIATHILAWEGGANWFWFEGNFEAYEKNKIERLGAEAARPHRVTYRKLTRG
jgi:ATP-binding cassette ChvD family protein